MLSSSVIRRLTGRPRCLLQCRRQLTCSAYRSMASPRFGDGESTERLNWNPPSLLGAPSESYRGVGDYPDYPARLNQSRSPYDKFDDQQMRRNFEDPLNENDDVLNMWSPDYYDYVSNSTAATHLGVFFLSIGALTAFVYFFAYPPRPAAPRSYPFDGLYKELGGGERENEIVPARPDPES